MTPATETTKGEFTERATTYKWSLKFTLHLCAFSTPGLKLILKVGEGGGPSDPGAQGVSGGKVEKHKKKKKKKDHKKKHDRKDREHKKHKKHKRKPLGEEVTLIEYVLWTVY